MEKMTDLRDLLKHEIFDLRSAEQQIIEALPKMITKATNPQLKSALEQHLQITQKQLSRLEKVLALFNEEPESGTEKKGLLARLFKRNHICRGMQGLIEEGEKIMAEDMNPEVLDAAIIASAQKIEHYEICGYGTAKAFAIELNLAPAVQMLDETLQEEYEADGLLTQMAVSRINKKAEVASKSTIDPLPFTAPSQNNPAVEARQAIQERSKAREVEPALVSHTADHAGNKKPTAAKTKAPKGEAERTDNKRETSPVRRQLADNNTKKAKTTIQRKTAEGRSSKTNRSR